MNRYNKYHIKDNDRFDHNDFPKVQAELDDMVEAAKAIPAINKEQIILSYLRDHSLENAFAAGNPELTRLLNGGHFTTSHIEALFESSNKNKSFQLAFEDFIRKNLAGYTT